MATAELETIIKPMGKIYREATRAKIGESVFDDETKRLTKESISLGVFVYDRLNNLRTEFCEMRKQMGPSKEVEAEKMADEISEAYRNWLEASQEFVDRLIRIQKLDPHFVDSLVGFDDLKSAFKDVSLMSLDTERVKRSIASLHAGQGVTFEHAMEELRNNLR